MTKPNYSLNMVIVMPRANITIDHYPSKTRPNINIDTEPLNKLFPIGSISILSERGKDYVIANYVDQLDEHDMWLEDAIRNGNEDVIDELDKIAELAMEPEGVNLICSKAHIRNHGQTIERMIRSALGEI